MSIAPLIGEAIARIAKEERVFVLFDRAALSRDRGGLPAP
jgi:hypothetical protein